MKKKKNDVECRNQSFTVVGTAEQDSKHSLNGWIFSFARFCLSGVWEKTPWQACRPISSTCLLLWKPCMYSSTCTGRHARMLLVSGTVFPPLLLNAEKYIYKQGRGGSLLVVHISTLLLCQLISNAPRLWIYLMLFFSETWKKPT